MEKHNWKCLIFGHKWIPVVINKEGKFKFVACYCSRCNFGNKELLKFVEKNQPIINSYEFAYWYLHIGIDKKEPPMPNKSEGIIDRILRELVRGKIVPINHELEYQERDIIQAKQTIHQAIKGEIDNLKIKEGMAGFTLSSGYYHNEAIDKVDTALDKVFGGTEG